MWTLLADWPRPDPCIFTSVIMLVIAVCALLTVANKKHMIIAMLAASIASITYRKNREIMGRPNPVLLSLDVILAIVVLILCLNEPSYIYLPAVVLFAVSWYFHFSCNPVASRSACVGAHCLVVITFFIFVLTEISHARVS